MAEGRSVKFEGLGSFRYVGVSTGQSVDSADKVSADQFKGLRVRFVPARTKVPMTSSYTRALVRNIGFMEWKGKEKQRANESGTTTTLPSGGTSPVAPDPSA